MSLGCPVCSSMHLAQLLRGCWHLQQASIDILPCMEAVRDHLLAHSRSRDQWQVKEAHLKLVLQ